jgi:hypothetical protein
LVIHVVGLAFYDVTTLLNASIWRLLFATQCGKGGVDDKIAGLERRWWLVGVVLLLFWCCSGSALGLLWGCIWSVPAFLTLVLIRTIDPVANLKALRLA